MARLEIRDACIVKGEPVAIGTKIDVDSATAKVLLSMGRAVLVEDESQPEAPAEAPRPRTKVRANAQPTNPETED